MELGDVLEDRYVLRARLGAGATSEVYRADDERLGRPVAIKVFRSDSAVSDAERRRRESRVLATLRHPAIVALLDAHLDAEPPYLVLECVEGESLADAIARGPLSREATRRIGAAAAAGLARAHELGIVHRDVKPANVLIPADDRDAAARLLDFGIAQSEDEDPRRTTTGTVLGSPSYLSPEQARGHDVTPASDVYSLGLVLIECLTGRPAFPGSGAPAIAARLVSSPSLVDPALAGERALLAAMTAADPVHRPDAATVARELAGPAPTLVLVAAAGEPEPTQPLAVAEVPRPTRSPGPSRRMPLAAAAAAALLAAAIGTTVALTSSAPTASSQPDPEPTSSPVEEVQPAPAPPEGPAPGSGDTRDGGPPGHQHKDDKGKAGDQGKGKGKNP